MQLAKDAGATSIIIETGSKLVVDLWLSRSTIRSEINPILCDIETKRGKFRGSCMCQKAFRIMFQNMWMHVTPNFLLHIVQNDCTLMNDE
jgi:hypothetical protein